MTKRERNIAMVKRIATICFVIAFAMGAVLFGGIGRGLISSSSARIVFMISGGLGLLLNLFTFESGKNSPLFNFIYWGGSLILFGGLISMQFRLPYATHIVIGGLIVMGISIFMPSSAVESKTNESELLDD